MEKIKSYIIAGLILFLIVFFSVRSCHKQEEKAEVKMADSTGFYKSKLEMIQAQVEALRKKLHTDSVKSSIVVIALKSENKALKLEVKKARTVHVEEVINDNPDLDKFVDLQDSLIANLDATVDTLELQKVKQWKSFNEILAVSDSKFKASQDIANHVEQLNFQLKKDVRKEMRMKTVWQIVAGSLAAGIIYQSFTD